MYKRQVQAHGSNDNQFFIDTARGMITGFILLVALYAPPKARHIISVFELVVQCSAPESLPAPGAPQRTMIASLLEHINDRRIRNYVAPASSADNVSYTHLDVYKRQHISSLSKQPKSKINLIKKHSPSSA